MIDIDIKQKTSLGHRLRFTAGAFTLSLTLGFISPPLLSAVGLLPHAPLAIAQSAPEGGMMQAMPVPVVTIEERPIKIWKSFSGRLSAVEYVEIRPQVSGIIEEVLFQDGQIVEAGKLLYKIDPRPYEAAVAQAEADLSAAREESAYAEKELERADELVKTGALSKQTYDQRINQRKITQTTIAAAQARLKSAQVDLDRARIEAPISGKISRPEITAGNLVNAASAPLLTTIVSNQGIYADFEVDEQTYLKYVRSKDQGAGDRALDVRISLAGGETNDAGMLKSFDNKINPKSGTIRARAFFNNADATLVPGMLANVQIADSTSEKQITVPVQAVSTDQSKKFVYVVDEKSQAAYREVILGDSVGTDRVVLSGLTAGDRVIVDGLMKLRPGVPVAPKTPEEMMAMQKAMMQAQMNMGTPPPTEEEPTVEKQEPPKEDGKKNLSK